MRTALILLVSIIFMSCTDNDLDSFGEAFKSGYISPELKPHVDAFINEGAKRGIYIQVNHLHIFWKKIGNNKAGKTWRYTWTIQIDRENSALDVRSVVFHEMGHLYLHREHDNRVYGPHSYPKSIMCAVNQPDYKADPSAMEYYYDELFNPNTPLPDWISK